MITFMRFRKTVRCALVLCALVSSTALCASAQRKNVQRVQFPQGRTTAILKGVLKGEPSKPFYLRPSDIIFVPEKFTLF